MVLDPWNLQVELTEGCNRMCDFCGIHSIWKNKEDRVMKYMSLDLAGKIAVEIGEWLGKKRIEFAMHGEPLCNSEVYEIIEVFRKKAPNMQYMLSTNGIKLHKNFKEKVERLFECGLNILLIDTYNGTKKAFLEFTKNLRGDIKVLEYYGSKDVNPYQFISNKCQYIVIMDDLAIQNRKRATRVILNHAGNVNFDLCHRFGVKKLNFPLRKKCSRVFRELIIHNDGTVPICCMDWRHEFIVGKFPDVSLKEIWNNDIFDVVRQMLYDKNRYFTPCRRCDYNGGFRLGFIDNPELELDEIEMIENIKNHLDIYKKYGHKNAEIVVKRERDLRDWYI